MLYKFTWFKFLLTSKTKISNWAPRKDKAATRSHVLSTNSNFTCIFNHKFPFFWQLHSHNFTTFQRIPMLWLSSSLFTTSWIFYWVQTTIWIQLFLQLQLQIFHFMSASSSPKMASLQQPRAPDHSILHFQHEEHTWYQFHFNARGW